jgi:hypothetical protein
MQKAKAEDGNGELQYQVNWLGLLREILKE